MDPTRRAYIELHIAVFLFGFTAILGKLITVPETALVWWRVLFTILSLLFLVDIRKLVQRMSRRRILHFLGIGVLVAIHWVTFFGSAKASNVSICLVCMATTSFFTAILEPFIMRQRIQPLELALGLLIIPGMFLVVQSIESFMLTGVILGLISAFLAALFSTINKKILPGHRPIDVTVLEIGGAFLFLSLLMPFYYRYVPELQWIPLGMDWIYLIILALVCTTLAYVLSIRALQYISAFASNLAINLEPVYGILLAIFILKENKQLESDFYIGVLVILIAVFSYPIIKKLRRKKKAAV